MSRIILSRWSDGSEHLVVGWDHPSHGTYFQEFNEGDKEPEVLRDGGLMHGIPIGALIDSMPEDLRGYVTADVITLLYEHSLDPDSGYGAKARPIDLTRA